MVRKKLVVHRKAYTRKAYTRKAHARKGYWKKQYGKRVYIKPTTVKKAHVKKTRVPASTFKIKDKGKVGRGKKLIKVRKGRMTYYAEKGGFIKKGEHVSSIPLNKMDDFARYLARKVGPATAQKMFRAQLIYRKRAPDHFAKKMRVAHNEITKKYESELAPKQAIRKWKSMSHKARAKAVPERKNKRKYRLVRKRIKRGGKTVLTHVWIKRKRI